MTVQVTTNTNYTVNYNGQNYTFPSPHPVEDLIDQLNDETNANAIWTQRLADSNDKLADLNSQIAALCTTPTP